MIPFEGREFEQQGFNLYAVLNLKDLPDELGESLAASIDDYSNYTQLILIGHAGQQFWQSVKTWQQLRQNESQNPIDEFSFSETERLMANQLDRNDFKTVFPGERMIDLQALGHLVGWHHESPMKLGINQQWGTWFAYRSLVLARSHFVPIMRKSSPSPCDSCIIAPCINACPVGALDNDHYDLPLCLEFRQSTGSQCAETCLARQSCHIAREQKYSEEQIRYHYRQSLLTIRKKH